MNTEDKTLALAPVTQPGIHVLNFSFPSQTISSDWGKRICAPDSFNFVPGDIQSFLIVPNLVVIIIVSLFHVLRGIVRTDDNLWSLLGLTVLQ